MHMKTSHLFFSLLPILMLASCTSYGERYFVGVRTGRWGDQVEPAQFYRFELRGQSVFQRTEFQSGWYDKDAVDVLFSEVVSEVSKRNAASGGAVACDSTRPLPAPVEDSAQEKHYVVFGPEGERLNAYGKRFVIIAANNPKMIADEIQAIADDSDLADAMTGVMQRTERAAAYSDRYDLERFAAPQRALEKEVTLARDRLGAAMKSESGKKTTRVQDLIETLDQVRESIPAEPGKP